MSLSSFCRCDSRAEGMMFELRARFDFTHPMV